MMKPPPIKTAVLWNRANYLCRVSAEMKPSPIKTASLWLLLGGALLFVAINGKPETTETRWTSDGRAYTAKKTIVNAPIYHDYDEGPDPYPDRD